MRRNRRRGGVKAIARPKPWENYILRVLNGGLLFLRRLDLNLIADGRDPVHSGRRQSRRRENEGKRGCDSAEKTAYAGKETSEETGLLGLFNPGRPSFRCSHLKFDQIGANP